MSFSVNSQQSVDNSNDIVNMTFSELMVILIFITLTFIGSNYANLSRLNRDYQVSQDRIEELQETLRQLAISQPGMDAALLSRLVSFSGSMERGGINLRDFDFAEIEDIAEFLIFLQNNNWGLEDISDFFDTVSDRGYSNLNLLIGDLDSQVKKLNSQVTEFQQRMLASGNGIGVCWALPGASATEFVFDIVSLNNSFFVVPAWEESRQDEILQMPNMDSFYPRCEGGCNLTTQEFIELATPLRNFSREQANINGIPCYLPVRYFEHTDLNTGDKILTSQRYFGTAIRYRKRDYGKWRNENNLKPIIIGQ